MPKLSPTPSAAAYWSNAERSRFACQLEPSTVRPGDVPDAQRVLELEMEAVGQVMSSLRARYNSLAFINRLPQEILALIFLSLRDTYARLFSSFPLIYGSRSPPDAIEWVAITHVCRKWRTTAIELPSLWTHIPNSFSTTCAEEFLRRSRLTPIKLEHSMVSPVSTGDLAGHISQHLRHVRALHLSGPPQHFTEIIPTLCSPAPLLEKLRLNNRSGAAINTSTIAPSLPSNVFGGITPRLRKVCIVGWGIPWASLRFETLVSLEISQHSSLNVTYGDFPTILGALSRMPSLKFLTLSDVFPSVADALTPNSVCGPLISLPNLQRFSLFDDIRNCGLALHHISLPASAERNIFCSKPNQGIEFLLSWLSAYTPPSPIYTLYVEEVYGRNVIITAYARNDTDRYKIGKSLLHISLRDLWHEATAPQAQATALCSALPLGNLKSLDVWYEGSSTLDWPTVFSGNNSLRRVSMGFDPKIELDELTATILQPALAEETSTGPPFPSLRLLNLYKIRVGHESEEHVRFRQWLQRWGPCRDVKISSCCVDEVLMDELEDHGFMVSWDGEDYESSHEDFDEVSE
ncbi:hypothetical protein DENSPDRAFT_806432 [Dentipellis sp. KUC8613]|nr:hypothetical protein DENSPDRAFT_806432 [Dentipellis sp. KUC8613]